jgi:hypothetical protein
VDRIQSSSVDQVGAPQKALEALASSEAVVCRASGIFGTGAGPTVEALIAGEVQTAGWARVANGRGRVRASQCRLSGRPE